VVNVSEHRAMCAFIIAMFCKDFHQGQNVCLSQELIESCLSYFDDMQNPLLRQWSCLCLSMLWVNFPDAKWQAIKCSAHQRLCDLVVDCVAEVRAAMLHALTSFLGIPDLTPQVAHTEESIASMVLIMTSDGSAMVRKELLVFFSTFVVRYQNRFIVAAYEQLVEERKAMMKPVVDENGDAFPNRRPGSSDKGEDADDNVSSNTIFSAVWKEVLIMSVDPHPEIAENASALVDYVFDLVLNSQLATFALPIFELISIHRKATAASRSSYVEVVHPPHDRSRPPTPPTPSKMEGYFAAGLKRTASYAASLTNFAFGNASPSQDSFPKIKGRSPGMDKHPAIQSKLNGELNRPPDEKDLYHSPSYPPLKTPTPRSYKPHSDEDRPAIPLGSKFFEWSVEYFREPQMQPPEAEEPGSTDYNERLWRRNRNDRIIAKTQPQKEMAGSSPWDKPKGFWNNGTQPVKLCWHQFEDQLVITDDRDGVS
jgi:regulatory associated protein of mTOR